MRKLIILLLCLVFCFSGCGLESREDTGGLSIVATIFPGYDFARQVCGDSAEVTMLLPPGSESHSYEPSAKDIIKIQNCDLFIYVGGESDTWVENILSSIDEPVKTLRMMDCVEAVEEEIKEGMDHEEEKLEEDIEYDEHVWTSPKNAVIIVEAIAAAIAGIDPENAEVYLQNPDAYVAELERLDAEFEEFFAGVENKVLIFGDRFPMRYFVDAYGLDYYAAFPGCASETEPSAATIAFLIDKIKTEGITTVFYIELSNHMIADSIAEATGAKTALFYTCHNVTEEQLSGGASYVSLMEENLETLREAMR